MLCCCFVYMHLLMWFLWFTTLIDLKGCMKLLQTLVWFVRWLWLLCFLFIIHIKTAPVVLLLCIHLSLGVASVMEQSWNPPLTNYWKHRNCFFLTETVFYRLLEYKKKHAKWVSFCLKLLWRRLCFHPAEVSQHWCSLLSEFCTACWDLFSC